MVVNDAILESLMGISLVGFAILANDYSSPIYKFIGVNYEAMAACSVNSHTQIMLIDFVPS